MNDFLSRFEHLSELGAYAEGLPRVGFGGPTLPHAVLLLHGYSSAPSAFDTLIPALAARGIPYYAPALTGFGLDDPGLLTRARAADWRRDAWSAYAVLGAAAREVSVVGFSYGARLACYLAERLPVRRLVLVSPHVFPRAPRDARLERLLTRPLAAALARRLLPYVEKPVRAGRRTAVDMCDAAAAERCFQYPVLPIASLLAMWGTPRPDLAALRGVPLGVVYGGSDKTTDVPAFLRLLDAAGVAYREAGFAASGHNVLADAEREAVSALVTGWLAEAP